ncbi:MAG: GDP-mannose 4,6-dehydratase, partial [bacterium]
AGSHLADYCLEQGGVDVYGIIRWRSRTENIEHLMNKVTLLECDLRDAASTRDVIESVRPDYIFHLAAQSFVPTSWHAPTESLVTNVIGQLNIFEAVRKTDIKCRIQIACSSEEYGMVAEGELPIREDAPLRPLSPYGVSKVGQDLLGYQYYMSYKMDIVRTRAFNHTGPRRAPVFVVSDFAKQIAAVEKGFRDPVMYVGNLDAKRDFSDVRDVVRAYYLSLEKGKSGEVYNICSESTWRIGDMLDKL